MMSVKKLSSYSSVVVRFLLYSMAKDIGPYTLILVHFLTPYHVSKSECYTLDEIITADLFPKKAIERAAFRTINQLPVTFNTFLLELLFS